MTSPGVVYVDETIDIYTDLRLPKNWTVHYEPEWGSLQASMYWCLQEYPDATQYGWLADDTYPRTWGWDKLIEEATGDWRLSYCADDWFSNSETDLGQLISGDNLSSGLCWGGELVRTVGSWNIPMECRQAGIDTAWLDIVKPLGLHNYLPDVLVEHKNWRTGKRRPDAGDLWIRSGQPYIELDLVQKRQWFASDEYRNALDRVAQKLYVKETGLIQRIHMAKQASLAAALFDKDLERSPMERVPKARLDRLMGHA